MAWGESHFTTFDGTEFDLKGVCEYNLVSRLDQAFRVTIQKQLCGYGGVFCYISIKIMIPADGTGHVIHLSKGLDVHVDGTPVTANHYSEDGLEIKQYGSLWTSVTVKDLGLRVIYDGGK